MQRYSPIGNGVAQTDINGMLVAYEDYMIVSTRKEQLKAEVEELRASSFVTAVPVEEYEKLKAEVEQLRKELAESQENYHLVNEMIKGERNVHRTNTMMLKDQIDGLITDNQLLGERVLAYQRLKQLNDISRPSNEA